MIGFGIRAFFYGVPFDGFGTITSLILMLFGILFLFLGIVSEYVGMIYTESRGRPTYIIGSQVGFGSEADQVVVPLELQRLKISS
jgi:dolichol-phosphate mannosyltransferase